jgi:hypothetical protein
MIAAANAKGLDENSVDSIYLRRGTKEFEEFEKRPNPVNGLLMERHPM